MKTLYLSTKFLLKFREDNRETEVRNGWFHGSSLDKLTEIIRTKGFTEAVDLAIINGKALLYEGNHRLACAIRLNMQSIPVNVHYESDLPEDLKLYLSDRKFKKMNILDKLTLNF